MFDVKAARTEAQAHLNRFDSAKLDSDGNDLARILLEACNEIERLNTALKVAEHQMSHMMLDPSELGWD